MADWQTVRHDPTYEEPLDPELIPLLDALNATGFVTISSCSGHGRDWAHIAFAHSADERIERLARFVLAGESGDYRPYFTMWQKEILLEANCLTHEQPYCWSIEIHPNDVDMHTPASVMLGKIAEAARRTAERVTAHSARGESAPSLPPTQETTDRLQALVGNWRFWQKSDERFAPESEVHKFRGEALRQCADELDAELVRQEPAAPSLPPEGQK